MGWAEKAMGGGVCREGGRGYLGSKAGLPEDALGDAAFDDLGLRHQHVHEVAPSHQVKQKVQVVLVLQRQARHDHVPPP